MKAVFFSVLLFLCLGIPGWAQEGEVQKSADEARRLFENENNIIGLELVTAAGTDQVFYSRFGHAMLRFVTSDQGIFDDYVVSMVAQVPDHAKTGDLVEKGLFGGFPVLPLVKNTGKFWQEYVLGQRRPLLRTVIPTTPAMRHRLLAKLKEWIEDPGKIGTYTFLKNNCAGALAKLFEEADFPKAVGIIDPRIPTNLPDWFAWSALAPYASMRVGNLNATFAHAAQAMRISLSDLLSDHWPDNAEADLERLDDLEIKQLNLAFSMFPKAGAVLNQVMEHHPYRTGATLMDVMGFSSVPKEFYATCADESCANHLLALEDQTWSRKVLRETRLRRFEVYLSLDGDLTFSESVIHAPRRLDKDIDALRHLQLLLKAEKDRGEDLVAEFNQP